MFMWNTERTVNSGIRKMDRKRMRLNTLVNVASFPEGRKHVLREFRRVRVIQLCGEEKEIVTNRQEEEN